MSLEHFTGNTVARTGPDYNESPDSTVKKQKTYQHVREADFSNST